ncbi:MAG: glycosyltransferase [Flavobacteriales bacterium]
MSEQELVSVVMPAYNAERYIGEAIGSVLAQTWANVEVVVVNDGSKDSTATVARSVNDPRVRVIDQPNGGVSRARNTGIEAARGVAITFLDADDALEPRAIELKMEAMALTAADWAFSDMWTCDARLQPMGDPDRGADSDHARIVLLGEEHAVPGAGSNLLARTHCFADGLRFDPELSNEADKDMVLGLASRFKGVRVPEPLFRYRVLGGSMSHNIALFERDHLLLLRKAKERGLLNDRAFAREVMARCYWAIGGSWWRNAHRPAKALPWIWRAAMAQPGLVVKKVFGR